MTFDEIAATLGWIKPYPEVPLWYQERDGYCLGKFSINGEYQRTPQYGDKLDEKVVNGFFSFFPGNTFKSENKGWALPMLASDYFYHENMGKLEKDTSQELYYAALAMDNNSNLTPRSFSNYLRQYL